MKRLTKRLPRSALALPHVAFDHSKYLLGKTETVASGIQDTSTDLDHTQPSSSKPCQGDALPILSLSKILSNSHPLLFLSSCKGSQQCSLAQPCLEVAQNQTHHLFPARLPPGLCTRCSHPVHPDPLTKPIAFPASDSWHQPLKAYCPSWGARWRGYGGPEEIKAPLNERTNCNKTNVLLIFSKPLQKNKPR